MRLSRALTRRWIPWGLSGSPLCPYGKGGFGGRVEPQKNVITWRRPPTSQRKAWKSCFPTAIRGNDQAEQVLSDPPERNGSLHTSSRHHTFPTGFHLSRHRKVPCITCCVKVTLMEPTFYHLSLSWLLTCFYSPLDSTLAPKDLRVPKII